MTMPTSTPHDAVLAELLTQRPGLSSSAKVNEGPETTSLKNEDVADDERRRAGSSNYEPLHDPFTGLLMGLAVWAHMAHIRIVQSEIANLHVLMEGVGPGPPGEQSATGRSVPLAQTAEGDKWEDEEGDEEAEEKNARELEFARLAEKFNGRKEATANIINKLEELSQVVTAFHALKTPTMDFSSSRTITDENNNMAGDSSFAEPATNAIIPPPRTSASQAPFIESPVSVSVDRPSPTSTSS